MNGSDRYSDAEYEDSVPDILTREQMNEFDDGNLLSYRNEAERRTVDSRFTEMNRHINELTALVFALTEKLSSSNREGNFLNTISDESDPRSDK